MTARTLIVAASLLAGGAALLAGPLNPPAGPVASTYKTLSEVEPRIAINAANTPGDASSVYVLNQPGCFYLTGNVIVPAGKSGLRFGQPSITIDLNGFSIIGLPGSGDGITTNVGPKHTVVMNGSIRDCGGAGIDLGLGGGGRVIGVHVDGCGADGIKVAKGSIVRDCVAAYCGQSGFVSAGDSAFFGCTSRHNATGFGLVYTGDTVQSCVASHNSGNGFVLNNAVLTGCVAESNGGAGFVGNYAERFTGCRAGYNNGSGFVAAGACAVEACTAVYNDLLGFDLGASATIRNSTAASNDQQGIKVGDRSVVVGNQVQGNGGGATYAGIWCAGDLGRIEGNMSMSNGYGLYVSGTGNQIIRNTCSQNGTSNYYILAGNRVGAITSGATNASLINGNSGGGLGTTDPNANFGY